MSERDRTDVASTVLIVDDHPAFRAQARELLEFAGYRVIGEAENASDAIAYTHRLHPDAVLLDIQLPDADGFTVAAALNQHHPTPIVVLISSREAADYGTRLTTTQARGFIHKPDLSRARIAELIGAPS